MTTGKTRMVAVMDGMRPAAAAGGQAAVARGLGGRQAAGQVLPAATAGGPGSVRQPEASLGVAGPARSNTAGNPGGQGPARRRVAAWAWLAALLAVLAAPGVARAFTPLQAPPCPTRIYLPLQSQYQHNTIGGYGSYFYAAYPTGCGHLSGPENDILTQDVNGNCRTDIMDDDYNIIVCYFTATPPLAMNRPVSALKVGQQAPFNAVSGTGGYLEGQTNPYTYTATNGSINATGLFTALTPGLATITVRDSYNGGKLNLPPGQVSANLLVYVTPPSPGAVKLASDRARFSETPAITYTEAPAPPAASYQTRAQIFDLTAGAPQSGWIDIAPGAKLGGLSLIVGHSYRLDVKTVLVYNNADIDESPAVASPAWTATAPPLADSGQTRCFDAAGNVINCPPNDQPGYGQDASYQGLPPDWQANSDGTVIDNNTGLVWQQADSGAPLNWAAAGASCAALDLGGHSDWRLPSITELNSIVDFGRSAPALSPVFAGTAAGGGVYWSDTDYLPDPAHAWANNFINGTNTQGVKLDNAAYARCVRGAALPGPGPLGLTDGGVTVTDSATGLVWERSEGLFTLASWQDALDYCETLDWGGHTDWRLPNQRELLSLVDYSLAFPALDTALFPAVSDAYWSSTSNAGTGGLAWFVNFRSGSTGWAAKNTSWTSARCVRGGQEAAFTPLTLLIGAGRKGTVTIEPGGAFCDQTCQENLPAGTVVTLTATPEPWATFNGWGGACTNVTGPCTVTMDAAKTVWAYFDCTMRDIYQDADGDGYGNPSAASSGCFAPAGFVFDNTDCNDRNAAIHPGATEICDWLDNDCDSQVDEDFPMTTWYNDADLDGYGNPLSGITSCKKPASIVPLVLDNTDCNDNNFYVNPGRPEILANGIDDDCNAATPDSTITHVLNVIKAGGGSGNVVSEPAGILCGADCSEIYPAGRSVQLTAQANPDSFFAGWSGACTNVTGPCTVTMDAAKSVTATFGLYTGTVGSGTNVTVKPRPGVTVTFAEVSSAGTLTVVDAAPPVVSDNFVPMPGASYDITFTGGKVGLVTVCFAYLDSALPVGATETYLRLLHGENSAWADITISLDTAKNEICGESLSFSPFVVGGPGAGGSGQPLPVKLVSNGVYYNSVRHAYNAAASTDSILMQTTTINGTLNFNRSVTVNLSGGYDSTFTSQTGYTTLSVTSSPGCVIRDGKVGMDRIILM